jgi:hypothetical protein
MWGTSRHVAGSNERLQDGGSQSAWVAVQCTDSRSAGRETAVRAVSERCAKSTGMKGSTLNNVNYVCYGWDYARRR